MSWEAVQVATGYRGRTECHGIPWPGLSPTGKIPKLSAVMRAQFPIVALVLLLASAPAVWAQETDPMKIVGMDLKTATDSFGLPQSMFSFRGSAADRDDVVFYYSNHVYLFWFHDRVWQVRYDMRFSGSVFGVTLGTPREQIQADFSRPLLPLDDSLYFDVDTAGYPVRVRLVFAYGCLSDVYVYRSDF